MGITSQLHIFFNALTFFTRLPCPAWVEHTPDYQQRAPTYAPLIGCLVGAVSALVLVLGATVLPLSATVVLSMVVSIILTGALHEDGLADVCDGLGGGYNAETVQAIMKDSHIGAFGVIGLVLALLLKWTLLWALASESILLASLALISAHSLSRLAAVAVIYTQNYLAGKATRKAAPFTTGMRCNEFYFATVCGLLTLLPISVVYTYGNALLTLVVIGLTYSYLTRLFQRRLGGYNGDCLGCVQQLSELAIYLALASHLPTKCYSQLCSFT